MLFCLYSIAIVTIGFERESYTFMEPSSSTQIMEVFLVKEEGRTTERNYRIAVNIENPTLPGVSFATAQDETSDNDYNITSGDIKSKELVFLSSQQRIEFSFNLHPDEFTEGREGFLAILAPSDGSLQYTLPNASSNVFISTTIIIERNDCKH